MSVTMRSRRAQRKPVVVQFNNVLISLEANTPEAAYARLCNVLHAAGIEYTTDTYQVELPGGLTPPASITELWP